jgi:hypothetical protein
MTSRVTIFDPQGNRLTELDVDMYREWKISEYGTGKFDISVLDPKFEAEYIDFGNWVLVEHDKLPGWIGTIECPREWNGGTVTVNCLSGEARLKRALTRKDTKYHGPPGHVFKMFIEDSCSEIIGLKLGSIHAISPRHITVLDNFANCYDLICKIAEKRNEEWNIEPEIDSRGNVWFVCNWWKKMGTVRTTRLYEDKHCKNGVKLVEQGETYNRVIVKGAKGSWAQGKIGIYTDWRAVQDYGLYEYLLSDNTSKEEDDHEEYARAYVNAHKEPRKTFTLGLADVDDLFKEVRLGDTFTLETYQTGFTNGKLGCVADVRIFQMSYKDSENILNIVTDEDKEDE